MEHIPPIATLDEATDQWIYDIFKQYFKKEMEVVEIKRKETEARSGFLSEILYLDVILKGNDKIYIVIKVAPVQGQWKDFLIDNNLGMNEVLFYKIMNSAEIKADIVASNISLPLPTILYSEMTNDIFTIVMNNLNWGETKCCSPVSGETADLELTKQAVDAIAVMHAIGYSYIEKYGKTSLKGLGKRNDKYIASMSKILTDGIKIALDRTKIHNPLILDSLNKILSSGDYSMFFEKSETTLQSTIIHGDYWIGQIMYNKEGKKVIIIDWQFTEVGNPAYDITTFLLNSSDIYVYEEHLHEVVESYVIKINEYLSKLKCSVIISYDQVFSSVENALNQAFLLFFTGLGVLMDTYISVEKLDSVLHLGYGKGLFKL